jgi:phage portal protein BeeE
MVPLEAALLSIDQHNMAGAWKPSLLGQGARPSITGRGKSAAAGVADFAQGVTAGLLSMVGQPAP